MRDEFSAEGKAILAHRVGMKCSNPNCRRPTSGPQEDSLKAVNVGVAAHITAAAKGGPRFEPEMSSEERSSIDNGIWLCQVCAKLVDNDERRHSTDVLREWKRASERAALSDIENWPGSDGDPSDADLIRFYAQCFDRPAFQDRFHQEGSMEAFDQAIEDTITALNTGCLRDRRDRAVLASSKGKSYLRNQGWREQMDAIVDLLRALRSRYSVATRMGLIDVHHVSNGHDFCFVRDHALAEWMDGTRVQILDQMSSVAQEAGLSPLRRGRW